jgi:hypothetical protein
MQGFLGVESGPYGEDAQLVSFAPFRSGRRKIGFPGEKGVYPEPCRVNQCQRACAVRSGHDAPLPDEPIDVERQAAFNRRPPAISPGTTSERFNNGLEGADSRRVSMLGRVGGRLGHRHDLLWR